MSQALFRLVLGGKASERTAETVSIGTHSTCTFVVNDPLAAQKHARIERRDDGFYLSDLDTSTGTWVNGVEVREPRRIGDGDNVVLGLARLVLRVPSDAATPTLVIEVQPTKFHFKPKDWDKFESDPDEWVRSEVRFGKLPLARTLVIATFIVGLAAVILFLTTRRVDRLVAPGPLNESHAKLFASLTPGGAAFTASAQAIAAAGNGCAACHAVSGEIAVERCAACHAEMLEHAHPFRTKSGDSNEKPTHLSAEACLHCHSEHQGLTKQEVTEHAKTRLKEGETSALCARCHTEPWDTITAKREPSVDRSSREFGYDDFSHEAHLAKGVEIDCRTCHVHGENAGKTEFAAVGFDVCRSCHANGASSSAVADRTNEKFRAKLAKEHLVFDLAWHGTKAPSGGTPGCAECHASARGPEMRTVEVSMPATRNFAVARRGHEKQFSKQKCEECHADAEKLRAESKPIEQPFVHGLHLATISPSKNDAQKASAACVGCHAQVAISTSVAEASKAATDTAGCGSCHQDSNGKALAIDVKDGSKSSVRMPEFSHAQHGKVEGGCFACHAIPKAGASDERPAMPGPESCATCHKQHANIAGGACTKCHDSRDETRAQETASLFAGRALVRDDWPSVKTFQHFTGKHGEKSNAPDGCTSCHDRENLLHAKTVREVQMSPQAFNVCRDCHAKSRDWYHWH